MAGESETRKVANPGPTRASTDPLLYLDRDFSLIEFQKRVFEEAQDRTNPLLERVKFLSILGSNVDEFVMFRYPELDRASSTGILRLGTTGISAAAHHQQVQSELVSLVGEARRYFREELAPELAAAGIHVTSYAKLKRTERAEVDAHFKESILPVLTPLAFDPQRPFPHLANLSLNLAILLRDRKKIDRIAYLQIPESIPQFVPLHWRRRPRRSSRSHQSFTLEMGFVWLSEVVAANLGELFPGMRVLEAHRFRVIRNAEIAMEDWDASELLDAIEEGVRRRHFSPVVALVVPQEMPPRQLDILTRNLKLAEKDIIRVEDVFPLVRLMELHRLGRPELHDPPLTSSVQPKTGAPEMTDVFSCVREQDILLHHPYDSFHSVIEFLQKAAVDPNVLAIKMTVYRVGSNSPILKALLDAKRNGKEVTVVVELKARFDEENNVAGARALDEAGAHVVFGMLARKVHAKVCLVVRQEGRRIRRYVHMSSGNYNPFTSTIYTDVGLFTCNEEMGADATDLFNYLTGHAAPGPFRKMLVAPLTLKAQLLQLIRREIGWQQRGEQAHIIFKMNALEDKDTIKVLYQASQAGVDVDLLVRGICCLRPGVPGLSDNIRVRSIVGRFLEHSRIFYFRNGGNDDVYIGSADVMPRNLERRVEVVFPVESPQLIRRLRDEILAIYLADNVKARELNSDGTYSRARRLSGIAALSSQEALLHITSPGADK